MKNNGIYEINRAVIDKNIVAKIDTKNMNTKLSNFLNNYLTKSSSYTLETLVKHHTSSVKIDYERLRNEYLTNPKISSLVNFFKLKIDNFQYIKPPFEKSEYIYEPFMRCSLKFNKSDNSETYRFVELKSEGITTLYYSDGKDIISFYNVFPINYTISGSSVFSALQKLSIFNNPESSEDNANDIDFYLDINDVVFLDIKKLNNGKEVIVLKDYIFNDSEKTKISLDKFNPKKEFENFKPYINKKLLVDDIRIEKYPDETESGDNKHIVEAINKNLTKIVKDIVKDVYDVEISKNPEIVTYFVKYKTTKRESTLFSKYLTVSKTKDKINLLITDYEFGKFDNIKDLFFMEDHEFKIDKKYVNNNISIKSLSEKFKNKDIEMYEDSNYIYIKAKLPYKYFDKNHRLHPIYNFDFINSMYFISEIDNEYYIMKPGCVSKEDVYESLYKVKLFMEDLVELYLELLSPEIKEILYKFAIMSNKTTDRVLFFTQRIFEIYYEDIINGKISGEEFINKLMHDEKFKNEIIDHLFYKTTYSDEECLIEKTELSIFKEYKSKQDIFTEEEIKILIDIFNNDDEANFIKQIFIDRILKLLDSNTLINRYIKYIVKFNLQSNEILNRLTTEYLTTIINLELRLCSKDNIDLDQLNEINYIISAYKLIHLLINRNWIYKRDNYYEMYKNKIKKLIEIEDYYKPPEYDDFLFDSDNYQYISSVLNIKISKLLNKNIFNENLFNFSIQDRIYNKISRDNTVSRLLYSLDLSKINTLRNKNLRFKNKEFIDKNLIYKLFSVNSSQLDRLLSTSTMDIAESVMKSIFTKYINDRVYLLNNKQFIRFINLFKITKLITEHILFMIKFLHFEVLAYATNTNSCVDFENLLSFVVGLLTDLYLRNLNFMLYDIETGQFINIDKISDNNMSLIDNFYDYRFVPVFYINSPYGEFGFIVNKNKDLLYEGLMVGNTGIKTILNDDKVDFKSILKTAAEVFHKKCNEIKLIHLSITRITEENINNLLNDYFRKNKIFTFVSTNGYSLIAEDFKRMYDNIEFRLKYKFLDKLDFDDPNRKYSKRIIKAIQISNKINRKLNFKNFKIKVDKVTEFNTIHFNKLYFVFPKNHDLKESNVKDIIEEIIDVTEYLRITRDILSEYNIIG